MSTRPVGVTLLALVSLLLGLWGLLKGLALLGVGGAVAVLTGTASPTAGLVLWGLAATFGIIALVIGASYLAFAWGALGLRGWAWSLGVWTAGLSLAWSLLVVLGPGTMRGRLVALVVHGAVLFYLTRPEIRGAFGKS